MARTASERFRSSGRRVLRNPANRRAHEARVAAASRLEGTEPLQGALADLLHGCAPDAARSCRMLQQPRIASRLAPVVAASFLLQARSSRRLPRVTPLATRYCVLAMPSLDVPERALLCSVDDSREIAATAIPLLLAGDDEVEAAFLAHCEGARDTLAFMLARRALLRLHPDLPARWQDVASRLETRT